jgi:ribonucleoside-diphosphate reductase subunit M1
MLKMVHHHLTNNNISIGIKSTELDNLLAETIAYLNILHPDYGKLAARVAVTKLHKETHESFKDVINSMYHYTESNGKCN